MSMPPIITRDRGVILAAVLAVGIVQTLSIIATAQLMKHLLDDLLDVEGSGVSVVLFAGLIGLAIVGAGSRWIEQICAERIGNSYVHDVRLSMYDALTNATASIGRFAKDRNRGIHMVRFTSDLNSLRQWVSLGYTRLISAVLFLIGVIAAIAMLDTRTAAFVLMAVIAGSVVFLLIGIGFERAVRLARSHRGRLANTVSDSVINVRHLAAFGRVPRERKRLRRKSDNLNDALVAHATWVGAIRAYTDLMHRLIVVAVLVVGSTSFLAGSMPVSTLMALLSVATLIGTPLRDFSRVYEFWKNAQVSREKIGKLLSSVSLLDRSKAKLAKGPGRLVLERVAVDTLKIPDCLIVEPRQRIAIIGENGTGKSSLLRVIAGLVPPERGTVKLDEVVTTQLSNPSRRRAIGIASNQIPLVSGSINKNIRYRKPDATQHQLEYACVAAGLAGRIDSFENGLDTRVGPDGLGLADGDCIRVKLACAIIGTPRLLLLDEIEQGLDIAGRQALTQLIATYDGTIIYATHDSDFARGANCIWRLQHGSVAIETPYKKRPAEEGGMTHATF